MRKIRKSSNKKFIAIAVILLLAISIGYAALSTTLSINGTANIASSSWLVYFTNVEVATGSVTATTVPTTIGTSTTTLTWAVSMDTPGQFYEYTVDVKNDGSIDAMIGTLSNTSLTTNQAKYLDYTVTYSDGAAIEQYDKLDAGETVKVKVRLEFKRDLNPEDLPGTAETITLTYTSNYVQADGNAKDRNTISTLNIGDTVNYSTSMNGVTLDNWKVFYVDGDYTTLIYGDYLPSSAVNFTNPIILSYGTSPTYGIRPESQDRAQFLDFLQTKANWSSLLMGTVNGTPIDYSDVTDINIWAMGTPTLDLWVNSWNTLYPEDKIYTAQTTDQMSDELNGYYVGLEENPTTYRIDGQVMEAKEGYNNILYYPYHDWLEYCYSYFLASPSAYEDAHVWGNTFIMIVNCRGSLSSDSCYGEYDSAIRPVVTLPTSAFE